MTMGLGDVSWVLKDVRVPMNSPLIGALCYVPLSGM